MVATGFRGQVLLSKGIRHAWAAAVPRGARAGQTGGLGSLFHPHSRPGLSTGLPSVLRSCGIALPAWSHWQLPRWPPSQREAASPHAEEAVREGAAEVRGPPRALST